MWYTDGLLIWDSPYDNRAQMRVSILDVAKHANVSISTVSRVLNRSNLVNPKTRARVESAIAELGYQPNLFARGLMLRRSEIIGLVLPDMHGDFYSEIIRGAGQRARENGYLLVVSSAHEDQDSLRLFNSVGQRAFLDGIAVMVSEQHDQIRDLLGRLDQPFVVLEAEIDGQPHDSVVIDQRSGALELMRHVVEACGARRVIFVGGLQTNVDTIARFEAYRYILEQHDLPSHERDVFHLDYEYETAYQLAREHIRDWVGPANCVFAANDEMAAGIAAAANAAGYQVPRDIAIVGFDDTRFARMTHPPLTTVRVPMSEMGAAAIDLLCARITDPQRVPQRISLQPSLVVRESCGHAMRNGSAT